MLKKKLANNMFGNADIVYTQKKIADSHFKGYACLVEIKKAFEPVIIDSEKYNYKACILDDGYEWLEIYPDGEKYAIIVVLDEDKRLVQWYFDIIKSSGLENGIPYVYDLFLDLLITAKGEYKVLDEDELEAAFENKEISLQDFDMAYSTLNHIQQVFTIFHVKELTKWLYARFKKDKIIFNF